MDYRVLILVASSLLYGNVHCKVCHRHKASAAVSLNNEEQITRLSEANSSCIRRMESEQYPSSGLHCNLTFDGIMCWPFTPNGTVAVLGCPNYINKFNTLANVTRVCSPNGEWKFYEGLNSTWSDYTMCLTKPPPVPPSLVQEHMPKIRILYKVGYAVSLTSLIMAVTLMLIFKKLHCQRNTIHLNLFVSFILRSIICFVKDTQTAPPGDVVLQEESLVYLAKESNWRCKLVYSLFQYLLTANYTWIFVESLYLYTLIFFAVFQQKKWLKIYIIIGWCCPLLCVIPWVIVRKLYEDTVCWNTHDQDKGYYWILKGPVMATIVVNFFFFVNIIRVLFTKLTASNTRDPKKYRKLAKSTLVLIPLFGVYYMIFVGIPDCLEEKYQIIRMWTETIFNSFQGFVVALLFCFLNGEVRSEIHKKWKRQLLRRRSVASTRVSFSIGSSFLGGKDRSPSMGNNDFSQREKLDINTHPRNGVKRDHSDACLTNGIKAPTTKCTKTDQNELNSFNFSDDISAPML